jgi:hypothetical protein
MVIGCYLLFVSVGFSTVCSSDNNDLAAAAAGALLQPCLVAGAAALYRFEFPLHSVSNNSN